MTNLPDLRAFSPATSGIMKPPVETVRISQRGRDQLIKLKRQTGIEHWNILCRWALCASLKERAMPVESSAVGDGGIEMTWRVFAGDLSDVFAAVLAVRAQQDGLGDTPEALGDCLRLHLHRGLGYLASGTEKKTIDAFFSRWMPA
jgi:DNA sulfur modification protein DndE